MLTLILFNVLAICHFKFMAKDVNSFLFNVSSSQVYVCGGSWSCLGEDYLRGSSPAHVTSWVSCHISYVPHMHKLLSMLSIHSNRAGSVSSHICLNTVRSSKQWQSLKVLPCAHFAVELWVLGSVFSIRLGIHDNNSLAFVTFSLYVQTNLCWHWFCVFNQMALNN